MIDYYNQTQALGYAWISNHAVPGVSAINVSWNNRALETVLGTKDIHAIWSAVFPNEKYKKKNLYLAFQELIALKQTITLNGDAESAFAEI